MDRIRAGSYFIRFLALSPLELHQFGFGFGLASTLYFAKYKSQEIECEWNSPAQ